MSKSVKSVKTVMQISKSDSKKLNVTFSDRVNILALLPSAGDKTQMLIIRSLVNKLMFSEEEKTKYNIQYHNNGMVTWDKKAHDLKKELELSEVEIEILKFTSKEADTKKKLPLITSI